jgi:hypothetical protein
MEHLEPRAGNLKRKREQYEQTPVQLGSYAHRRQLTATRKCAFKAGFAAEGMLCNEPPIPLRVLDFLGTYELINLSLVCKAMHQAGHVLLEREVRGSIRRACSRNMH